VPVPSLPVSYEEEDTCVSYEEEDTCVSYEEEDTCVSYEEEDTCVSYEEVDQPCHLPTTAACKSKRDLM
jgi:hypothetical protein